MKLTESEWRRVFEIRCRAKRGERIDTDETKLIKRAIREDSARYQEIGSDAFEATAPFGSNIRRKAT